MLGAALAAASTTAHVRVAHAGGADAVETVSPPKDGFYGKRLRDGKIAILGHASVSDEALLAARDRLERLLRGAPKIRANLEAAGYELHVIGLRQFASDLPEYRAFRGTRIDTGDLFDWHMIGGHLTGNTSSCAEATLLPIVGHRLYGDDTCVHELAHAVEWIALEGRVRNDIDRRWRASLASHHWDGAYAAKDSHEWLAEVTKLYFRDAARGAGFYLPADSLRGRDWLCGYDADACAFVRDLFSGAVDPGTPRMVDVPLRPGRDEHTLKSGRGSLVSHVVVTNRTSAPFRVVWIDFQGARDPRRPIADMPLTPPGAQFDLFTYGSHAWAVLDASGNALCTFVAPDTDGRVVVERPCN